MYKGGTTRHCRIHRQKDGVNTGVEEKSNIQTETLESPLYDLFQGGPINGITRQQDEVNTGVESELSIQTGT